MCDRSAPFLGLSGTHRGTPGFQPCPLPPPQAPPLQKAFPVAWQETWPRCWSPSVQVCCFSDTAPVRATCCPANCQTHPSNHCRAAAQLIEAQGPYGACPCPHGRRQPPSWQPLALAETQCPRPTPTSETARGFLTLRAYPNPSPPTGPDCTLALPDFSTLWPRPDLLLVPRGPSIDFWTFGPRWEAAT